MVLYRQDQRLQLHNVTEYKFRYFSYSISVIYTWIEHYDWTGVHQLLAFWRTNWELAQTQPGPRRGLFLCGSRDKPPNMLFPDVDEAIIVGY